MLLTNKDAIEAAIEIYNRDIKYYKKHNVKSVFLRSVQKHLELTDDEFSIFVKDYRC